MPRKPQKSLAEQKRELSKQIKQSTRSEKYYITRRNLLQDEIIDQNPTKFTRSVKEIAINKHNDTINLYREIKKDSTIVYNALITKEKKIKQKLKLLNKSISLLENALKKAKIETSKRWIPRWMTRTKIGKKTQEALDKLGELKTNKSKLEKQQKDFQNGKPTNIDLTNININQINNLATDVKIENTRNKKRNFSSFKKKKNYNQKIKINQKELNKIKKEFKQPLKGVKYLQDQKTHKIQQPALKFAWLSNIRKRFFGKK